MAFEVPAGFNIETILFSETCPQQLDLRAFDQLYRTHDDHGIEWLNHWVESQETCNQIMVHHGREGLNRVLRGIAKASSVKRVHMGNRVAAIAGFYEYEVY